MELIIHILMLFIVINCSFKLSFWKLWQTVILSAEHGSIAKHGYYHNA